MGPVRDRKKEKNEKGISGKAYCQRVDCYVSLYRRKGGDLDRYPDTVQLVWTVDGDGRGC